MFKVDSDIPVPPRKKLKYPFTMMSPGDSFFVEGDRAAENRLSNAARAAGKSMGAKFTARMVEEGGKRGIRIWRVS